MTTFPRMKPTTTFLLAWTAMFGIWISPANGQDKDKDSERKTKFLRVNLLPVGDFPVTGAIIVNDRPVVVMPKPSELIPTPVFVKDEKEYKSLNLNMNSPTAPWRRPCGSVIDLLTRKDGEYHSYMSITLPEEKEDATIFMLRNEQSKDWTAKPRAVVFKNGIESFPLGSARMINFSSVTLRAAIGKKTYLVPPKTSKIFTDLETAGESVAFMYEISATIKNHNYTIANTAVSYDKQSRVNLVVYDRDGKSEIRQEGDDRPVKLVKYFELPYQPPTEPATAPTPPSSAVR